MKQILPDELLGYYVNSDDIEQEFHSFNFINLADYGINANSAEVLGFFHNSLLLKRADGGPIILPTIADGKLSLQPQSLSPYWPAVVADFLRQKLLTQKASFTFETVMSHPDKIALLKTAQDLGYRTYLYYVATDDPDINLSRVQTRVAQGGHAVPEDKIISRYHRSLSLLMDAIRHTNRAYIFDNSRHRQQQHTWLAEVTDGHTLEMKADFMPAWFKQAVWDKIAPD